MKDKTIFAWPHLGITAELGCDGHCARRIRVQPGRIRMNQKQDNQRKGTVIFVRWFRHWKTGKIIRAEDYGKKAFAIPVDTTKRAA
jgi:hypothetical protein